MIDSIHCYPFLISRTATKDNPILKIRIRVSFSLYIAADKNIGIKMDKVNIG